MNTMPVGKYTHNVDVKGRVFVPSKFRPDLGNHFTIFLSPKDKCIRAYNEDNWNKYRKKLARIKDPDNGLRRLIFSSASDVETDSQGRILIPSEMLSDIGVTEKMVIVGMDRWVEMWEPDEYDRVFGINKKGEYTQMLVDLDAEDDPDCDF